MSGGVLALAIGALVHVDLCFAFNAHTRPRQGLAAGALGAWARPYLRDDGPISGMMGGWGLVFVAMGRSSFERWAVEADGSSTYSAVVWVVWAEYRRGWSCLCGGRHEGASSGAWILDG